MTKALFVLVQKRLAAAAIDRILYFHAARADRLLYDTVTEILTPLQARGITEIDTLEIQRPLKKWVDAGKTSGQWSEPTILRIAQGLLSALRDFGVLQGAAKKRIAPAYLPIGRGDEGVDPAGLRLPDGAHLLQLLFDPATAFEGQLHWGRRTCDACSA